MAKNLFRLYHYFDKEEYYERSKNMSLSVTQEFETYPSGYSNWFDLIYNLNNGPMVGNVEMIFYNQELESLVSVI